MVEALTYAQTRFRVTCFMVEFERDATSEPKMLMEHNQSVGFKLLKDNQRGSFEK